MKLTNKILEAVNRGIQLALDDFEDDSSIQNIKSKQVQNRDYTKEYLDLLKYEVVDLGLPSGTLWCKYNLGVNSNQLFRAEDWYGDYYAWGETETNKIKYKKSWFDWYNYKIGNGYKNLTKYCNNPEYGLKGFTDNLTKLLPKDDAVYQNKKFYNFKFHIPSKEQCQELINYTNSYWVNNYNPNKIKHNPKDDGGIQRLNGRVFIGKNENQIFIPASGSRYQSDLNRAGICAHLWTSNLDLEYTHYAYNLYVVSDGKEENIEILGSERCAGFAIRPVINL